MHNLLARLIGENIELRFLLDPNLGLVRMDPTQAQQILLNLVLNARDAMPAGGEITVETSNCQVQIVGGSSDGESSLEREPACALSLRAVSWSATTATAWTPQPVLICSKLSSRPKRRQGHGPRTGHGPRDRDQQRRPDPCRQRARVAERESPCFCRWLPKQSQDSQPSN